LASQLSLLDVGTSRLEILADAIFAIAATLLILDVSVQAPGASLGGVVKHAWPQYAAYGVSFLIIGIWWVNHHHRIKLIDRADRAFLFANIALLACIAFLPFPTELVAKHLRDSGAHERHVVRIRPGKDVLGRRPGAESSVEIDQRGAARRLERRRDWSLPATPQRKDGEIVVVDGYSVSVRVERSQLAIGDGAGRNRRERRFGRATSRLARHVVLGGSGSLSLEAIRWLDDVGAALLRIGRDGLLLITSGPTMSDAKLRRAQALARFNETGLVISKIVLSEKLKGQRRLLDRLDAAPHL
jgi:hypothetical protein